MIFFGAGASNGSDNFGTPPLTPNLFNELVKFDKDGWGQMQLEFSKNFIDDSEEGMKILSKSNSHLMPLLQRAMAKYFFKFYPQPTNLYRKLARRIKKSNWNGVLSSINYERLLELSLIEEGLQPIIRGIEEDLQPIVGGSSKNVNGIELCLPHGCCHLFCESVRGMSNIVSFAGSNVKTSGKIKKFMNSLSFKSVSLEMLFHLL